MDAGFGLDMPSLEHGTLGLSLHLDENRGGTLLTLAAQAKHRNAAEAAVDPLLERGAQLNQPTGSCNHTPLLCTVLGVAGKNVLITKSFVRRITNNQVYEDESEQLHQCFDRTTDSEVLATKLLLEKGAGPLFLNRSGKSPLTVVAGARRNDIKAVKMMLEYVDQNVPISTIKSHILAATAPYDDSHDTLWAGKKPSLIIQKTLWN